LGVGEVGGFETFFYEGEWLRDGQLSDSQEGLETDHLIVLRCVQGSRPEFDACFEKGFGRSGEGGEVGYVFGEGGENKFLEAGFFSCFG